MNQQQTTSSRETMAAGFDRAAPAYNATGTEFFGTLGAALVRHAAIKPGERIADLGCGKGAALIPAARAAAPGGRVTGIDNSRQMLARAGQAARERGLSVALVQGDAQDPDLPRGELDVIMASSVIQFLPDPRRAVRNWLPLLTPGGRLALSWGMRQDPRWVPAMEVLDAAVPAPHPGFEAFMRREPFDSKEAFEEMLAQAGYVGAVTHDEPLLTEYDSPEQWWHASQNQGPGIVSWQHIPAARFTKARDEALGLVEGLRDDDGKIRRNLAFGCTVAFRPAT